MSKIATLAAGPAVETIINLQFAPQYLLVGNAFDGSVDLSALSWSVSGNERVNLTSVARINAFSKFKNNVSVTGTATIAAIIAVGDGQQSNKQFQLRMTNNAAATQDVYGFSQISGRGKLVTASEVAIVDTGNQRFQNFMALTFDKTNVPRVDLTFMSQGGQHWNDSFTGLELDALFSFGNPSEAGELSALTVIDNSALATAQGIWVTEARIYAAGGTVTVMQTGLAAV